MYKWILFKDTSFLSTCGVINKLFWNYLFVNVPNYMVSGHVLWRYGC